MAIYHKWQPIAELESAPKALADGGFCTMLAAWLEQRDNIDPEAFQEFDEKQRREWSVETGLIERVYTFDRGITETLIERGIDAAYIPHSPGGLLPEKTAAIIQDHKHAVDGLFAFVKGNRAITTSYIKELHAALVQNQDTATGVDKDGNKKEVPLIKGEYKILPNNPHRRDGKGVHEYCPPEHTAAEMDRLIKINDNYTKKKIAPEVQAAWLHHRFTQIHPFQDGNGRVARCLATLIFIRAGGFPLIIRDINGERKKYLDALEYADSGDLRRLISVFVAGQRREIARAIDISREVMEGISADANYPSRAENIIKSAAQKIAEREAQDKNKDNAQIIAGKIHGLTVELLTQTKQLLSQNIGASKKTATGARFLVKEGVSGYFERPKLLYYRRIARIADEFGYYPHPNAYHAWARLVFDLGTRSNILVSFHGVGKTYRGVLACSASFLALGASEHIISKEEALTDEPFFINNQDTVADVKKRFRPWLESAIERGLAYWQKSL